MTEYLKIEALTDCKIAQDDEKIIKEELIEIGKDSPREANMIFHVGGNSTNELYSIYKLLTKIPHVYILLTKTVLTV